MTNGFQPDTMASDRERHQGGRSTTFSGFAPATEPGSQCLYLNKDVLFFKDDASKKTT